MKKIGLIILVMVVALGSLGVVYAHWNDYVDVEGVIQTGEVDVQLSCFTNDEGNSLLENNWDVYKTGGIYGNLDPKMAGYWLWPPAPGGWVAEGGVPQRYNKNIASANCELLDGDVDGNPSFGGGDDGVNDEVQLSIKNGYPSYYPSMVVDFDNVGTIPVKLYNVVLEELSYAGYGHSEAHEIDVNMPLYFPGDFNILWYVHINEDTGTGYVDKNPDGADFSILLFTFPNNQNNDPLSEQSFDQIDPGHKLYLQVSVHVLQDAWQLREYDFNFKFDWVEWNAP